MVHHPSTGERRGRRSARRLVLGAAVAAMLPATFAAAVDGTWLLDGNGNWGPAANWSSNPAVPNVVGDTARFLDAITANRVVNQDIGGLTLGAIEIDDNNSYLIDGNAIALDALAGNASIAVNNVNGSISHTIATSLVFQDTVEVTQNSAATATLSGVISGVGGLIKKGSGTLRIGGPAMNTFAGDAQVHEGTLHLFKTTPGTPSIGGNLIVGDDVGGFNVDVAIISNAAIPDTASVTVNSSGRLQVAAADGFPNLIMKGGSVTISGGGAFLGVTGNLTTLAHTFQATISGPGDFLVVAPGTMTVADGTAINDLVIEAPINSGAVTKAGVGTLVLSGNNTYTSPTTVNAGTLVQEMSQTRSSVWTVASGALAVLSAGGNRVIRTGSVSVSGTGRLDLVDNKLIVTSSSGTGTWNGTNYTGVAGLVDSGRGNAGNALWDGGGIVTSDTRAISTGDLVSICVAKVGDFRNISDFATTTFAGQTVSGSHTVAMVTWGGDANLDGKINIDDYGRIDGSVGQSGSVFGWFNGDFNYNGKINIDDYGIIDGNIGRQGTPFVTTGSATSVALEAVRAVPEPSWAGAALVSVAFLFRKRQPPSS